MSRAPSANAVELWCFLFRRERGDALDCSSRHADELEHLGGDEIRAAREELARRGLVEDDATHYRLTAKGREALGFVVQWWRERRPRKHLFPWRG